MRALVVLAHPSSGSFCAHLFKTACETLAKAGHEVDSLDLYREGFDNVLSEPEWTHFIDRKKNQVGREHMISRLQRAQILVLIYPVWLLNIPGILKSWYDRVWVNGVAFIETKAGARAGLTRIRHVVFVPTHGAKWWQVALAAGNPNRRWSMSFHRIVCGRSARLHWLPLYDTYGNELKRTLFVQKVEAKLRRLA